MDFITSNSSSDGVSSISVSFDSGTDGNINQVNVQNRVSLAEPQLPEEVRKSGVTVNKASNSILLVYNFVNEDPFKTEYSVETISGYLDKNLLMVISSGGLWGFAIETMRQLQAGATDPAYRHKNSHRGHRR